MIRNSIAYSSDTRCYAAGCDQSASKHCGRCCMVHYCSRECQRRDWGSGGHKHDCVFFMEDVASTFQWQFARDATEPADFTPFAKCPHGVKGENALTTGFYAMYYDHFTIETIRRQEIWPRTDPMVVDCTLFVQLCWHMLGARFDFLNPPKMIHFGIGFHGPWVTLEHLPYQREKFNFQYGYLTVDGETDNMLAQRLHGNSASFGQWVLRHKVTGLLLGLLDDFDDTNDGKTMILYAPEQVWVAICKKRIDVTVTRQGLFQHHRNAMDQMKWKVFEKPLVKDEQSLTSQLLDVEPTVGMTVPIEKMK